MYREGIVSIIVPVHNTEKYLNQCVRSIMDQTYRNLEIILIDDNSTDKCGEMCDAFAKEDTRVKVIHTKAGSAGAARNAGLDIATGEYIGFVDSDDWIEPDMYEKMLAAMKNNHYDIVISSRMYHDVNGKEEYLAPPENMECNSLEAIKGLCISIKIDAPEVFQFFVNLWDKLFTHDLWENIRFNEHFSVAEDREALFRIYQKIGKMGCATSGCYNYRAGIGISKSVKENNEDTYCTGILIYDWAKKIGYKDSIFTETMICHSLGRVRAAAFFGDRKRFFDTFSSFEQHWHEIKKALPGSKKIFVRLSYALRYAPHLLWLALRFICHFREI